MSALATLLSAVKAYRHADAARAGKPIDSAEDKAASNASWCVLKAALATGLDVELEEFARLRERASICRSQKYLDNSSIECSLKQGHEGNHFDETWPDLGGWKR